MIIEYHRPKTIEETMKLISRESPPSYPLGGGTFLNRGSTSDYAVVDLQDLELRKISNEGNKIRIGATVTLQDLLDFNGLPEDMYKAISLETTYNLRQMATIAGSIITANGRSSIATVLLALDAGIEIRTSQNEVITKKLGDWLPLRHQRIHNELITSITIPNEIQLAYEYIARTPADQPIVCAAVSQWNSRRTRLALGGWNDAPILAMDGPSADGIEIAAKQAYSTAGDNWANADYRHEMAGVLSQRCINRINELNLQSH